MVVFVSRRIFVIPRLKYYSIDGGSSDPVNNIALAVALKKARSLSVPKDNITAALNKVCPLFFSQRSNASQLKVIGKQPRRLRFASKCSLRSFGAGSNAAFDVSTFGLIFLCVLY